MQIQALASLLDVPRSISVRGFRGRFMGVNPVCSAPFPSAAIGGQRAWSGTELFT